jgi:hypothetical protein
MNVRDVMTATPMTIDPEAPVETAVGVEEGPDAQDEDHCSSLLDRDTAIGAPSMSRRPFD